MYCTLLYLDTRQSYVAIKTTEKMGHTCIMTDKGNYFVRYETEHGAACFYLSPKGEHLTNKNTFHDELLYTEAQKNWKQKETELLPEFTEHARKIAKKFVDEQKIRRKNNPIAVMLESLGVHK